MRIHGQARMEIPWMMSLAVEITSFKADKGKYVVQQKYITYIQPTDAAN